MAPEAPAELYRVGRFAVGLCIAAATAPVTVQAHGSGDRSVGPLEIPGAQYSPVAFADIAGWNTDNHLDAFRAFRASCRAVAVRRVSAVSHKALGASLREPCRVAKSMNISDNAKARAFFEDHFRAVRISRLGETAGFVTGYYEPIIDGSRARTDKKTKEKK